MSGIVQGEMKSLSKIEKEYLWGKEQWILSSEHQEVEDTPLLVKIIQAKESLSIQVHPDNEYARKWEGCKGKTEMWYILDCEKDAFLYYGLKHRVSPGEFTKRIKNHTILEICRKVKVKKGDVFFIPPGMVHAIGKGITLAEVQQNSNITYRIYDYERKDSKNQLRTLHIDQAGDVMDWNPAFYEKRPMGSRIEKEGVFKTLLTSCPYFKVSYIEVEEEMTEKMNGNFRFFYFVEGEAEICYQGKKKKIGKGDNLLLTGKQEEYQIRGKIEFLVSEGNNEA